MARHLTGAAIIALGIFLLLQNLGFIEFSVWEFAWRLWPVIFIYWGGSALLQGLKPPASGLAAGVGLIVMAVGVIILGNNFDVIDVQTGLLFRYALPLLVIGLGFSILRASREMGDGTTHWAVLSGLNLGKNPFQLRNSNLISVLGGGELDLRKAKVEDPEVGLHILSFMGGWEIKVPHGMRVEVYASSFLGGVEVFGESAGGIFSDRRFEPEPGDGPIVKLRIQSMFGGAEVKRV